MKSSFLLAFALLGAPQVSFADNEDVESQEPNVLERYDLRPVLPRVDQGTGWAGLLTQLPPPWWTEIGELELHGLHEDAAPDVILNIVTQVLGDSLNVKGSQIALESDSTLLVLAPTAVQSMVVEVLGVLESVLSTSVDIRIDVISIDEAMDAVLAAPGVVPAAEADRLVETLTARGASHREHTFQLASGRTSAVDQSRSVPFVFDYDVEIAQGSFIWDPIILDVMEGMRLYVRGVPKPTGTLVSALILQGDLLDGVQDRPLDLAGAVSREQTGGLTFVSGPQSIQTVEMLTRSFAFTTFLPADQAVILASSTRLGGKPTSHFVVMRQIGKATPAFVSTQVRGTNRTLALVNAEMFRSPTFNVVSRPNASEMTGHPIVSATLSAEYSSFLYDWMRYRYSAWSAIGPWVAVVTDPAWDSRGAEAIQELVQRTGDSNPLVDIRIDMVSSAEDSNPPVSLSLPVLAGTSCGAVLGVSGTVIRDYDVEVAQYSAVPDPFVQATFNGLAVTVEVAEGRGADEGSSTWVVDVRGTGQLFRGTIPVFDSEGPVNGQIDRPEYDVLNVNERLRLPRVEGGTSGVRIGPDAHRVERGGLNLIFGIKNQ